VKVVSLVNLILNLMLINVKLIRKFNVN